MLLTIIIFLFILSILVIAHEAGHFMAAKRFGVQVDEFALGFPPRAKTLFTSKDGVKWTLNWLPIGGFVKMKGEDGQSKNDPDSFGHKQPWKRVVILSAGVLMNFVLAFILLTVGYSVGWPQDLTDAEIPDKYIQKQNVMIVYVEKDTPALKAGLKAGDIVTSIDGHSISEIEELQARLKEDPEKEFEFLIERDKVSFTTNIKQAKLNISEDDSVSPDVGVGIALAKFGVVRYPVHLAIGLGAKNTVIYTGKILKAFANLFRDLIIKHKVSPNLGGPVMIAALSGRAARMGFIYILQFIALLSLNLAIINFLPIPALDGGRILFVIIEKFKGRAVSMNIETWIHVIGFWLLIGLTVLITARDLSRFQVWDKIKNLFTA